LSDRFDRLPIDGEIDQDRMGWHVEVPDVVVDELVAPDHLSRSNIEADEALSLRHQLPTSDPDCDIELAIPERDLL
jgi:hypothetical protein